MKQAMLIAVYAIKYYVQIMSTLHLVCRALKFSIHGHVYEGLQYHTIPVKTESLCITHKD